MILKTEYNEKIDYLVCKQIAIKNNTTKTNEARLKDCFFEKRKSKRKLEKQIMKVKYFLSNFNKEQIDIQSLVCFYIDITKEKIVDDLSQLEFLINNCDNLEMTIIKITKLIINKSLFEKAEDLMIKLIINILFMKHLDNLIVLYHNPFTKIKMMIKYNSNFKFIANQINSLYSRTICLNDGHDIGYNEEVYEILDKYKEDFMNKFDVFKFGIYGSFSTKSTNKYSDLDIIVIVKCKCNYSFLEKIMLDYFKDIILINIDIKVVNYKKVKRQLTIGMRKSLKILGVKNGILCKRTKKSGKRK